MKALIKVNPISVEKRQSLVEEFINSKIVNKIDDVQKISISHLTIAFERFVSNKFDLPIHVNTSEFMIELQKMMPQIGYRYKGHSFKIRFNDVTKSQLEYDRVVEALDIDDILIAIDSHRYFEKVIEN